FVDRDSLVPQISSHGSFELHAYPLLTMARFSNISLDSNQPGNLTVSKEDAVAQAYVPGVDSVICREVTSLVSCTLDELAQRVPAWAQVLAVVDRFRSQGTLTLRRATCV